MLRISAPFFSSAGTVNLLGSLFGKLLIVTRASLQPYACGHLLCWPTENQIGKSNFSTCKELSDHVKANHGETGGHMQVKVFRCALPNCGKSWKASLLFQSEFSTLLSRFDRQRMGCNIIYKCMGFLGLCCLVNKTLRSDQIIISKTPFPNR
jgi:hypothetical protein